MEIQKMLDAGVNIPTGEYEGPFLINRPSVTDGGGSTLYIRDTAAAALNIGAEGVTVKNLNIQAATPDSPALLLSPDTTLENVFVYGCVIGKKTEEGFFDIPYSLSVGSVPADEPFEFTIKIEVPADCEIAAERGVSLSSAQLSKGTNTVGIRLPQARAGSIIRRSVYIKTAVFRRMIFTAKASSDVKRKGYAPLLFEPLGVQTVLPDFAGVLKPKAPQVVTAVKRNITGSGITTILPKPAIGGKTVITRGMHYPLAPDDFLEIEFITDSHSDIDAYVFLHDGSMVMRDSRNLVFFGNDNAMNNAISYLHTNLRRAVYIDLGKITNNVGEIDVVYASYDNTPINGTVTIKTRNETISIFADGSAPVITAFQITANSPGFVLTPLIMPYRRGIAELIRSYGLEVN
jgi:stress response protein SCP2